MILNTGKCHYMCKGKNVEENETLRILGKNFKDKNRSKIFVSPTYQKHFQESRPKTKCIIENFRKP